jgi:hypothetical protein
MIAHPYFRLHLHTDEELKQLLNSRLTGRTTIHEWPLSCIQKLELEDGRMLIYKSQYGPSVEAQFYRSAVSPLLIHGETIFTDQGYTAMIFEYLNAPRLIDLHLPEEELVTLGRQVSEQISEIRGSPPIYCDIGSVDKWVEYVENTTEGLNQLSRGDKLVKTTPALIKRLKDWALLDSTKMAVQQSPRLVHGDANPDNIFLLPDGLRVIDWQRPYVGPAELDLVTFLEGSGISPLKYVSRSLVGISRYILIHWFMECRTTWFPEGTVYDATILKLGEGILNLEN